VPLAVSGGGGVLHLRLPVRRPFDRSPGLELLRQLSRPRHPRRPALTGFEAMTATSRETEGS
jgi:hypothetical protein